MSTFVTFDEQDYEVLPMTGHDATYEVRRGHVDIGSFSLDPHGAVSFVGVFTAHASSELLVRIGEAYADAARVPR